MNLKLPAMIIAVSKGEMLIRVITFQLKIRCTNSEKKSFYLLIGTDDFSEDNIISTNH